MNNLNPMTETNASQEAKEGREYKVIKDGRGGEHRVINFDWEGHAPKKGLVEVIPLKMAKGYNNAVRHQNEVNFSRYINRNGEYHVGVATGFDRDGFITWKRFTVRGAEFLDLSIKADREKWICMKYAPFMKGSPNFLNSTKTVYEAVDKEREANNFIMARRVRIKASEIAGSLVGEELSDMALALGLDPKSMSPDALWVEVVKYAENTIKDRATGKTGAETFLEIYNSESRQDMVILKRAISTGIVAQTPANGINWNGHVLGYSEPDAVAFLRQNQSIRASIDMLSRKTQSGSTQAHEAAPVVLDEESAKIKRLQQELADKERQILELSRKAAEADATEVLSNGDTEIAELLEEGKRLGLKGFHMIGRGKSDDERKLLMKEKLAEHKNMSNN